MAMIKDIWWFAFIALGATSRAEKKGRTSYVLPCRLATQLALGSLASVALSSIRDFTHSTTCLPPVIRTSLLWRK